MPSRLVPAPGIRRAGGAPAPHRGDDRPVAAARLGRAAHEALVDLDLVEWRFLQITERGIAGPEIIQRKADADLLERGERVVGCAAGI